MSCESCEGLNSQTFAGNAPIFRIRQANRRRSPSFNFFSIDFVHFLILPVLKPPDGSTDAYETTQDLKKWIYRVDGGRRRDID